jgi:hypothetical protein
MVSRVLIIVVLLIQITCVGVAWADARWIEGIYRLLSGIQSGFLLA